MMRNRMATILVPMDILTLADCKKSSPVPCDGGAEFWNKQQEQTEAG